MSFVNPTYLWAFLGLLVPIAIHFWSNKEGKIIKIGSVKFIEASDSAKSRSIKLNEYLLLFLRLLLLSFLVLILAKPELKQNSKKTTLTYLIEPNLLENNAIQSVVDSVKSDIEVRVFTNKFPELDRFDIEDNNAIKTNYWQLAQQVDELQTDSVVVFTSGKITNLKGKRPTINKPIKWIVLEGEFESKSKPLLAFKRADKIDVFSAKSTTKNLSFEKETLDKNSNKIKVNSNGDSIVFKSKTIPLKVNQNLRVLIAFDKKYESQTYYLESSIKAIEKFIQQPITIEKTEQFDKLNLEGQSLLIWFGDRDLPKSKVKILQYKNDDLANNIIEESQIKNVYSLTELLSTQKIVETNFTNQLLELLAVNKIEKPLINKVDKRIVSEAEIQTNFKEKEVGESNIKTLSITNWLWLPFILLLIIERIVAKYRNQ